MALEVLSLGFALAFGLGVRLAGLPPLVGFLVAGFALNAFGDGLGLPESAGPVLEHVAHLGVLLLLFTVGLKLKIRQLVRPEVVGTGVLHFAVVCAVFSGGFLALAQVGGETALLLGAALSFSSTVLAAKVLESKRELKSFHGRTAMGVLIVQDLIAIAALAVFGGHGVSPWALVLLALPLLALPPLRALGQRLQAVLFWPLDAAGHEELFVLAGMILALGLGGAVFEALGLSGELGALVVGIVVGNHRRAQEMANALWSLREVFLVGFFLQIGLHGLPGLPELGFAALVAALLPLKAVLFFFLLLAFHLRARNALLTALTLTAYSEFGLIVAIALVPQWQVPLALAVAVSFVIAAPLNRYSHALVERFEDRLKRFETRREHPDEQPIELAGTRILVLGMGRVGTAAYDFLARRGQAVGGLDNDPNKVQRHQRAGRSVRYADAEDPFFWHTCRLGDVDTVVLAMQGGEGKALAARQLRKCGFAGAILSHAMFDDEAKRIEAAGADHTYLTMHQAGEGLGERVWEALATPPAPTAAE